MDKRYNATKAILAALKSGRHLSQMDCHEFQVEDMRTYVSHLKPHYQDTHDLKYIWIHTPVRRARIKEYWLEKRDSSVL